MQQYTKKRKLEVYCQVTEEKFSEAQAICPQLRKWEEGDCDIIIDKNGAGPIGNWGCYLVKSENSDNWMLLAQEGLNDYEPVSAPSGPWHIEEIEHKPHLESGELGSGTETIITDGDVEISSYDLEEVKLNNLVNALNGCEGHMSFNSSSHFNLRNENDLLKEKIRQLKSEGWLQWVCATVEVPSNDTPIPVKIDGIYRIGNFFYERGDIAFYVRGGADWVIPKEKFSGIFWLKENASPSTANTEEGAEPATMEQQKPVKKVEKVSGDIQILCESFRVNRGPIKKMTVTLEGVDLQETINRLLQNMKVFEFIQKMYIPEDFFDDLLINREQAFAEWVDTNEYYKNAYTGEWHKKYAPLDGRFPKVFATSTSELRNLFLTETKQQP